MIDSLWALHCEHIDYSCRFSSFLRLGLQVRLLGEALVEFGDFVVKAFDLLAKDKQILQILIGVFHLELLQSDLVLFLRF